MKKILRMILSLIIPTLSLTAAGTNPSTGGGEGSSTNPASTEYAGSAKYHIGDYAEGGVIIWLTADGQHGLVAAIGDVTPGTTYAWAVANSYYATARTDAINNDSLPLSYSNATPALNYGGGKNQVILDNLNQNPAQGDLNQLQAALAAQGYSYTDPTTGITYTDWFLPASSELSQMYAIRDTINSVATANGGADLTNTYYWSSRETNVGQRVGPGLFGRLPVQSYQGLYLRRPLCPGFLINLFI